MNINVQEMPGVWSILGACLVTVAVMVSSAKKIIDGLSPSHPVKTKYLSCFYSSSDHDNSDEDDTTDKLKS